MMASIETLELRDLLMVLVSDDLAAYDHAYNFVQDDKVKYNCFERAWGQIQNYTSLESKALDAVKTAECRWNKINEPEVTAAAIAAQSQ